MIASHPTKSVGDCFNTFSNDVFFFMSVQKQINQKIKLSGSSLFLKNEKKHIFLYNYLINITINRPVGLKDNLWTL